MNRLTIDELEMLNPEELGELLIAEIEKFSPDVQHIKDLIAVGCLIDARDEYGRTALHIAVISGQLKIVEFLVQGGAQLNAVDIHSQTPLHWAAAGWGHLEVVKYLISKGADIHARDNAGSTAWDGAAKEIKEACPELSPGVRGVSGKCMLKIRNIMNFIL